VKAKPVRYSYNVAGLVESRIPPSILEAMAKLGWNAFGIYEVVVEEIARERRQLKRAGAESRVTQEGK
jgi:hypothetical protein